MTDQWDDYYRQAPPRQPPPEYGQQPPPFGYAPPDVQAHRQAAYTETQRHRRGGLRVFAAVAAVVLFAAVIAGALTLTRRAHLAAAAAPVSCHQQYQAWKTGPAKAAEKRLAKALDSLQSAGDDLVLTTDGLKRAGRIAHQLQAYPMPACADPAGYWKKTLADIRASGDNASTSSGLGAVLLAMAPLKKAPALEKKLGAELKTTTK